MDRAIDFLWMGNLHSAITQRIPHIAPRHKAWLANVLHRIRRLRDEITEKIYSIFRSLQLRQDPLIIAAIEPTRRSDYTEPSDYSNPSDFLVYHGRIEVYNSNEQKLVYFVCGLNFILIGFLVRFLFF